MMNEMLFFFSLLVIFYGGMNYMVIQSMLIETGNVHIEAHMFLLNLSL